MSVPRRRFRYRSPLLASLAAFAAACGSDSTTPENPTITVTTNPTSATVVQGGSTPVTVTVTGAGGFGGTATIEIQNVPSGVTWTVGNIQSSNGTTTGTVTIGVGAAVTPGTYDITVRASGTGVSAVTVEFALTVTAAPSFALSADPAQLAIEQGGSETTSIEIARTNFTGGVQLAVEGAPTGMTASFDPNPATAAASTLTLEVGAATAPGNHTLTVRGTAAGLTERTTTVQVLVSEPGVPDLLLGLDPDEAVLDQGGSVEVDVTLTRSNLTGAVTLAAEDVPAGVSVAFDTNPVTGDGATMTFTATGGAPVGTYTVTIRATATGITDRTIELELLVQEAPTYTLTLAPTSLTVEQGGSGQVDVTLVRTNFAGAVTLALDDAPAGVTGTFSINPVSGGASVLTLDVDGAVDAGEYELTVRGQSTLTERTAALVLTVTEAEGFTLGALAGLSIAQGGSAVRTVEIVRTGGFAGDVTVTVTELPAGITATVDPVTTTGASVEVTIEVAGTVAPGPYTANVRGNASGLPESSQALGITVTATAGEQITLDFSACAVEERPVWVAYQDGASAWSSVTGTGDVYTFTVASDEIGIALAVVDGGTSDVSVQLLTSSEVAGLEAAAFCPPETSGKTVTATVAGLDPLEGESAFLTLGSAFTFAVFNGAVEFTSVPDGDVHLVGYKSHPEGTADRMVIVRDLDPADGGDIGTVDFEGAGFDPGQATITLAGGSGTDAWQTRYATSPEASVCYSATLQTNVLDGETEFLMRGVPAGQQQASEFHVVTATAELVSVTESFAAIANRTITYPTALPVPTVTDVSTGYRRISLEVVRPGEYDGIATVAVSDGAGQRSIAIAATAARLDGAGVALTVPDFTGVEGWDDDWAPSASEASDWAFSTFGSTGDVCSEGARSVTAFLSGTIG